MQVIRGQEQVTRLVQPQAMQTHPTQNFGHQNYFGYPFKIFEWACSTTFSLNIWAVPQTMMEITETHPTTTPHIFMHGSLFN